MSLPSVVLWLITSDDSSLQLVLAPQFSWQWLLNTSFLVAYNLNWSLVNIPQRWKPSFPCSIFSPWADWILCSSFGNLLWKQVQILAQFLFIYSLSNFSNCCQIKTLVNQRQVNMPILVHCPSSPLCCGGGTRPHWGQSRLLEDWRQTRLRLAPHSFRAPKWLSLLLYGGKRKKLWARASNSGLATCWFYDL